jgi:hypothetical protein
MKALQVDYTAPFFSQAFKPAELVVWRFVRDQGGYWTAYELQMAMHQPGAAYRIGGLLGRLFAEDYLVRKMRGDVWAYGFTARCYAPEGESMAPVAVPDLAVVLTGGGA